MSTEDRSNVVRFPGAGRRPGVLDVAGQEQDIDAGHHRPSWLAQIGMGLLAILRRLAFFVLFWLRGIVRGGIMLLSGIALFALCACLLMAPDRGDIAWILGWVSFGGFVLGWLYDSLLLMLAPDEMMLDSGRFGGGH